MPEVVRPLGGSSESPLHRNRFQSKRFQSAAVFAIGPDEVGEAHIGRSGHLEQGTAFNPTKRHSGLSPGSKSDDAFHKDYCTSHFAQCDLLD
jgi:hypothetical protein